MSPVFKRLSCIHILAVFFASRAAAGTSVLLSLDNENYRQALKGIESVVPDAHAVVMNGPSAEVGNPDMLISLGDAAARYSGAVTGKRVAAMVVEHGTVLAGNPVMVGMLPDTFTLFSTINSLVPGVETLGVLSVEDRYDDYVRYLSAASKISSIQMKVARLEKTADLVRALRSMQGRVQAMWIMLDSLFMDQDNFKLISEFCKSNHIALFMPSPRLARAGGLAGLGPEPKDIGKAAGLAAKALLEGKNPGKTVQAERNELYVNLETAAALGLKVAADINGEH